MKRLTPTITPVALEPAIVPVKGIDLFVPGTGIFTVFAFGCVPVKAVPAAIAAAPAADCVVPVNGMPLPAGEIGLIGEAGLAIKAGAAGAGGIVPVSAIPPANAGLAIDRANTAIITAKAGLFTFLHILITPFFFDFKFEIEKNIKQHRFFFVRLRPFKIAFKRMIRLKRHGFLYKFANETVNSKFR